MKLIVPQRIVDELDKILEKMAAYKKAEGYKFFIGNPAEASLQEYDDSSWNYSSGPVSFKRHQGTTWFRAEVIIPEKIMEIPVEGAEVRLLSFFFMSPTDIYVDGNLRLSEKSWMDFKVPEIILTENAMPGQVFTIAVKIELGDHCYSDNSFSLSFIIDKVEDLEFEIASFKEELKYACSFKEVREILPQVFDLISGSLERKEGIVKLVENIKLSREMLRPMKCRAKKNTVHLIGHAHIDTEWFWSIEETRDVVRRDFDTMTRIMEEMPEFKFSHSQCATYEMAEKLFPEIFDRMKTFIHGGNWEVTASTWVEGDLNMSSGEAVVRHILYSKKYLREKLGADPKIMWCPDTFGHSGNIPQIARKSGIDYYYFMRCGRQSRGFSPNEDEFQKYGAEKPVFWWEGIDGSRILAFNSTYNSELNSAGTLNISRRLNDEYGLENSMFIYGTGDHGGGPTRRDLKRAKKLDSYPTTPRLAFSTAHSFFESITKENVPTITTEKGELNFVFDGCYTTHADIKKYNRKCENLLVSSETLATVAVLHGQEYDRCEIEECWKATLFNQFHDVLDGSGVKATYIYTRQTAEKSLASLNAMTKKYIKTLGSKIKSVDKGIPVIIFNTVGWERNEYLRLDIPEKYSEYMGAVDSDGRILPTQQAGNALYIFTGDIPSIGYKVIYLVKESCKAPNNPIGERQDFFEIDTEFYHIEIKKDSGEIITLLDRENKRYVVNRERPGWRTRNGVLNTLQVHYEMPAPMSAWTIGPISNIKCLVSDAIATVKADGPLVKIINFRHEFGKTIISQDIKIYTNSPRIDFATSVDWNETGDYNKEAPMLKACFVPDIDNRDAVYEIPFGAVERLCKDIEVPAMKWIDISDDGYGFSLLNDCKYGHRVKGNSMEITLIRSGWMPDDKSDVGKHEFVYSILPHSGGWMDSKTIKAGYCLNNELIADFIENNKAGDLPETASYVQIEGKNVVVSAFKPSESGKGIILRLYNGGSLLEKVKVIMGFDIAGVLEVDLNEMRIYNSVDYNERCFEFELGSYEIKTYKILL